MYSEVEISPEAPADSLPPGIRRALEAKLDSGSLELPLLPGVAMEVTSAAAKEDVDTRVLAEMLKRDPALSAHVLRIVNSPVYSPRSPIVSMQQAVARVGAVKIREIALVIACRTAVFKAKGYEQELERVFQHSIASALFAQEIARITRNNVEDAFLCGLLHDVGRPVLVQALTGLLREAKLEAAREAVLLQVSEFHERAGAALAKAWALPESAISALGRHHSPNPEQESVPVRIVALADRLAHLTSANTPLNRESIGLQPLLAALEIYPDMLDKISQRAPFVQQATLVLS